MSQTNQFPKLRFTLNGKYIFWISLSLITLCIFSAIAWNYSEPREIRISDSQANEIAKKVWMNEGAGKSEYLVVWNEGEAFPSLGIGHFIWYPDNVEKTYQESFPQLIQYIAKTREVPAWLKNTKTAPWSSRDEFLKFKNSPRMIDLRNFLKDTMIEQARFIANRLEKSLPEILKVVKNPFSKRHVRENFYLLANHENGVYALVDYVNFKGEGTSDKEKYNNLGWGLAQVLEHMRENTDDPLRAFVDSASEILTRRVENAPRDETRWLPGWKKRLNTYLVY